MLILPMHTRVIRPSDDLVFVLLEAARRLQISKFRHQDIVVVSSKAVATAEGRIINLGALKISGEAEKLSKQCGRSPGFCQAVLDEAQFRNGEVCGTCPGSPRGAPLLPRRGGAKWGAILTELKPQGLTTGTIFAPNAGLDESNIEKGFAVGWPADPVGSVRKLRGTFEVQIQDSKTPRLRQGFAGQARRQDSKQVPSPKSQVQSPKLAVILSDSCCMPRRRGVTAYALAVSGIDPLQDEAGKKDLFGKPLQITVEAVADQLATAANALMGNAAQSIPAVIIRDHGLNMSNFEGWVPGIEPGEDMFHELL